MDDELTLLRARVADLEARLQRFAHDCNNMLGGILGNAGLIALVVEPAGEAHEAAIAIGQAAVRAGEMVARLAPASVGETRTEVDLNGAVREAAIFLRGSFDRRIVLRHELDPAIARITADPVQVQQVLLNLAINARDAMPAGGEMVLRTRVAVTGVLLEVEDTGAGIPLAAVGRLFDDDYTTKPGRSIGLGLSIVRSIVTNHGGRIEVSSELGRGSVFKVWFPPR